MGNLRLARQAALRACQGLGERAPGWCSRWVRQVVQSLGWRRYDGLWGATATETLARFRAEGLIVNAPAEPGDVVFKVDSGPGHVGIMTTDGRIAENSVTRTGRLHGGIGYRTLAEFGSIDAVGRLLDPGLSEVYQRQMHGPLRALYEAAGALTDPGLRRDMTAALNSVDRVLRAAGAKG